MREHEILHGGHGAAIAAQLHASAIDSLKDSRGYFLVYVTQEGEIMSVAGSTEEATIPQMLALFKGAIAAAEECIEAVEEHRNTDP